MKHFINLNSLSRSDIDNILNKSEYYKNNTEYTHILQNKDILILYYSKSGKCFDSVLFEKAVKKLGGNSYFVNGFDLRCSEEIFRDTIRSYSLLFDAIVVFKYVNYDFRKFDFVLDDATVPLIKGFCQNYNPSKIINVLFTIKEKQNTLENLNIGIIGDMKGNSLVHELLILLKNYSNNNIYLITSEENILPENVQENYYIYVEDVREVINGLDVIVSTNLSVEKSKYLNIEDRENFYLSSEIIGNVKQNLSILHIFPRSWRLDQSVDNLFCAHYFDQVKNELYVKMAIFNYVFEIP